MGAIHLATQSLAGVERKCVIKEMLDYFDATDPIEVAKANQRFQAEAATLAVLSHPGIPKIRDSPRLTCPDPQAACAEMIHRANLAGGEDNISVIVVRVVG